MSNSQFVDFPTVAQDNTRVSYSYLLNQPVEDTFTKEGKSSSEQKPQGFFDRARNKVLSFLNLNPPQTTAVDTSSSSEDEPLSIEEWFPSTYTITDSSGNIIPVIDDASSIKETNYGNRLAKNALKGIKKADERKEERNTPNANICMYGVAWSLAFSGVDIYGDSAYEAADQIAKMPQFEEVSIPNTELKNLPKGSVVVWDKSKQHPHGHISIALGNGKEASDRIRYQLTDYSDSYRVFLPQDKPDNRIQLAENMNQDSSGT